MRFRWWLVLAAGVFGVGVVLSWVFWLAVGIAPGLFGFLAAVLLLTFAPARLRPVVRRPDYANIARLERELGFAPLEPVAVLPPLPFGPAPGAKRPCPQVCSERPHVPVAPCRHREVVEVTRFGQAVRQGLCRDCPVSVVDVDGVWVPARGDGHAPGCPLIDVSGFLCSPFDTRVPERRVCRGCGVWA